jgi:hypothetical protein
MCPDIMCFLIAGIFTSHVFMLRTTASPGFRAGQADTAGGEASASCFFCAALSRPSKELGKKRRRMIDEAELATEDPTLASLLVEPIRRWRRERLGVFFDRNAKS